MKPLSFSSTALGGSLAHFVRPTGPDLLARTRPFYDWQDARRKALLWPYSRSLDTAPKSSTEIRYDSGETGAGINFASQDYLSLASHPALHEAARRAIGEFGVHSAGSPALLGNTRLSLELEAEIAATLHTEHVVLFPTGWAAGFGAVAGLVRPYDHVVMDEFSHACLQQGVYAATRNVVTTKHLDVEAVAAALKEIRARDAKNGILVVTEGLFSMDSDTPEIGAIQAVCREHEAILLVDVAHDFGALGPGGTGNIGIRNLLGKVDLVMGSFSKTFASNGGFLATRSAHVKQFVKTFGGSHTFSNALSPVQAAIVLQALRIVRSKEGEALRGRLLTAVNALRAGFAERNIQCMGAPSAIVPVPVGADAVGRIASWLSFKKGVLANFVEFPAVKVGACRFRMQVMASHTPEQAKKAATLVVEAIDEAQEIATPIAATA